VSPSDPRRQSEASHVGAVGISSNGEIPVDTAAANNAPSPSAMAATPDTTEAMKSKDPSEIVKALGVEFYGPPGSRMRTPRPKEVDPTSDDRSAGATSFQSPPDNMTRPQRSEEHDQSSDIAWRETALQRRISADSMAGPKTYPSITADQINKGAVGNSPVASEISTQKPEAEGMNYQMSEVRDRTQFISWMIEQTELNPGKEPDLDKYLGPPRPDAKKRDQLSMDNNDSKAKEEMKPTMRGVTNDRGETRAQESSKPGRSASEVLSQLPKDDIDFLSAVDIRATMGTKKSRLPSVEERNAEKQRLARAFASAQQSYPGIDTMIESKIVNDQLVRRTERELREAKQAHSMTKTESPEKVSSRASISSITPAEEAPLESSVDRMRKWLKTTGANFAKQLWQDPAEDVDVTKTKLFFDKVMQYVQKGQLAMRPIVEDLEKDIPASAALLKRLQSDEDLFRVAILRLHQRSDDGVTHGLTPKKIKAMESLKVRFLQTNREFDKAHVALRELAKTEAATKATGSFKRRLNMASQILNKNAQLSRMLIYNLETRLEDMDVDRKILSNYKPVADNLLSLRDTQLTLLRLVDHAISVYGVVPTTKVTGDTLNLKRMGENLANCEEPFIHARLSADAHLMDQILSTKPDVQAAETPKAAPRTSLDDPKPLSNSLFRPFGTNISSNDEDTAKVEAKQKLGDMHLMKYKAYHDSFRTLTGQSNPVVQVSNVGEDTTAKKLDMIKEDPTATDHGATATPMETETSSKTNSETSANPDETSGPFSSSKPNSSRNRPPMSTETAADDSGTSLDLDATSSSFSAPKAGSTSTSTATYLPTCCTILVHDPATDTLSVTTSSTGPPYGTTPALPLHQALSSLDCPAKFVAHIAGNQEVVTAKNHMLVLRQIVNNMAPTHHIFETIGPGNRPDGRWAFSADGRSAFQRRDAINPIDGTARLSPTGYVGPEDSPEHLAREFDERRAEAGRLNPQPVDMLLEHDRHYSGKKINKKRGRVGRVVQTGIWAAAVCYVVGVLGEVLSVGGA
jgi:hypothetical protein